MTEMEIVAEQGEWRGGFEERLLAAYRDAGCSQPLAQALLERAVRGVEDWTLATDGTGWVAVGVTDEDGARVGRIHDLTAAQGRAWAERWCAEQGAERVVVRLTGGPGAFADYPVRGQNRIRAVAERPVLPPGLTVRRLREEEYPHWYAREAASYVADIVRAGALTPQQAQEKSDRDFAEQLPQGYLTPGHAFYVLEAGGEAVGSGWVNHGYLPGVTFGFSLEVYEEHRGRGYGRAAMAVGEWAARQGGDEALMFNVFGGNEVAMGLYDSTGFTVLEEFRSISL
ncbi:ribosomal protein S18 acetylase RimI-like enzyme [Streptomyces sp. 3211.6]|uniref:GNAT family N-acetyltransferase n=1 Tax=Streptomyces TaxID=1883 RepID=UPI0009A4C0AE|nr:MULTISPECIES: GNAT family N-acetyltransferase [Streptomyces]RKT08510.1 ribosomal protein S18 acetylase RimI-like enzyme [Streptomyces sp. 3211.6]RPF29907.1 ribosomal protein S18 acetylase RimI-like enzyme [Streptomyces sp. Ag109_G2-6]